MDRNNRIFGIDFGSEYIRIGELIFNGKFNPIILLDSNEKHYPLYISFGSEPGTNNPKILFGSEAKSNLSSNPTNTIYNLKSLIGINYDQINLNQFNLTHKFKIIGIKNKIYVKVNFQNKNKFFAPDNLIELMVRNLFDKLKNQYNTHIENIVLSLSDGLNLIQINLIKKIFTNLNVNIIKVHSDIESICSSYLYFDNSKICKNIVICDIGKTNINIGVCLIESGIGEVINTHSINNYSNKFDNLFLAKDIRKQQKLFKKYLYEQINNLIEKIKFSYIQINEIIFTGFNAKFLLGEYLDKSNETFFAKSELVVLGASILGSILRNVEQSKKLQDLMLLASINYNILANISDKTEIILNKNTIVPLTKNKNFQTQIDWSENMIKIKLIFEKDIESSILIETKSLIGYKECIQIPNSYLEKQDITINLSIDIDANQYQYISIKCLDSNKQIMLTKNIKINMDKLYYI